MRRCPLSSFPPPPPQVNGKNMDLTWNANPAVMIQMALLLFTIPYSGKLSVMSALNGPSFTPHTALDKTSGVSQ